MDEGEPETIFGTHIPFVHSCGIEAVGVKDGRTRLRLALRPDHANNLGIAHGGILCTLLDVALGTAARLSAGAPVVTLDMQTRFLNPGRGTLEAEGRVTRPGASVLFCEAEIWDASGTLVASATGLLKPVALKKGQTGTTPSAEPRRPGRPSPSEAPGSERGFAPSPQGQIASGD